MRSREFVRRCSRAATAALCVLLSLVVVGPGAEASNETYTYDNAGRLIIVDHGDGKTTTYTLDPAGNRTNVKTEQAGSPGALSIATTGATYAESQGAVSVVIRRTGGTVGAVAVSVATSATSADATISPTSVSWANGDSADKTVTFSIVNDTVLESTESFTVSISAPTGGATLGTPASITFTITDDDSVERIPPTTPTNLAVTAPTGIGSQLNLTWTASTDASGIKEYRVERCTGAGCSNFAQVATVPTNSFNNSTGLADVTAYTYRVVAVDNNDNVGSYSSSASGTTRDVTAPSAPTGLNSPWYSSNRIDLSWTASADNVGVNGYFVERCTGSGCSNFAQIGTTAPGVTTYTDQPLNQVTLYRYRVYAKDAALNQGAYSAVLDKTTDDGTSPTVPTNLAAAVISPNEIDLTWTASSDNVGVTVYDIYRNSTLVASVPGTSFPDNVLAPSTTYSYQIEARDAAMNHSGLTAVVQATTQPLPDTTPPSAPSNLTGSPISSNKVDLSWTPSTDTGGSGLVGYRIYRNGSFLDLVPASASPTVTYSDTTTVGTTTYNYVVYAYDGNNNQSAASNTKQIITDDTIPPTAPSNLVATAISGGLVRLTWTGSTDTGGSPFINYWIYRNGSGTPVNSTAVTHPTVTYDDTSTSANTDYSYVVVAKDSKLNASPASNTATVHTPAALSATVSDTNWLWWKKPNNTIFIQPNIVVTASGGTGTGYTYSWTQVSGPDNTVSASNSASSSTKWARSQNPPPDLFPPLSWTWKCRVTDSSGAFVDTPQVTVTFKWDTTN